MSKFTFIVLTLATFIVSPAFVSAQGCEFSVDVDGFNVDLYTDPSPNTNCSWTIVDQMGNTYGPVTGNSSTLELDGSQFNRYKAVLTTTDRDGNIISTCEKPFKAYCHACEDANYAINIDGCNVRGKSTADNVQWIFTNQQNQEHRMTFDTNEFDDDWMASSGSNWKLTFRTLDSEGKVKNTCNTYFNVWCLKSCTDEEDFESFYEEADQCQTDFSAPENTLDKVESYSWDFGDGHVIEGAGDVPDGTNGHMTTGTYTNPKHSFTGNGTYEITYVVRGWQFGEYTESFCTFKINVENCETKAPPLGKFNGFSRDDEGEIFPNPTRKRINVRLPGPLDRAAHLIITDLNGREQQRVAMEPGQTLYEYQLNDLSPGMHALRVLSGDQMILSKTFIVTR